MPHYTGDIPNFINGVSQQPLALRLPSQVEEMVNSWPSVADGLGKRPPRTEENEILITGNPPQIYADKPFTYFFKRTDGTPQMLVIDQDSPGGATWVFNLNDGTFENVVNASGSAARIAYFSTNADSRDDFQAVAVGDTVFMTNRNLKADMDGTTSLSGTYKGTKQDYSSLPGSPSTGDVWEITGDPTNNFDNYFVRWTGSVWEEWGYPGTSGGPTEWDLDTMPWVMTWVPGGSSGTWQLSYGPWADRTIGQIPQHGPGFWSDDPTLQPTVPSIVSKEILQVFFWRNRIGLVTPESIVLSRAGDYFNLWPHTLTRTVDSDPIDFVITHTQGGRLQYAVPFGEQLVVFSETAQFIVDADGGLAPDTIKSDLATEFAADANCLPRGLGPNLYFTSTSGDNSVIREYFVEENTVRNNAANVTSHVPKYVEGGIHKIVANSNFDTMFFIPDHDASTSVTEPWLVYVYQQYWDSQNEKVQSAWHKWDFGGLRVHGGMSDGNKVYFVTEWETEGRWFIESVDLQSNVLNCEDLDHTVHLDYLYHATGSDVAYDAGNDWTEITNAPYPHSYDTSTDSARYVVFKGADYGTDEVGEIVPVASYDHASGEIRITGDITDGGSIKDLWVGLSYDQEVTLSQLYARDQEQQARTDADVQIRSIDINCDNTAYMKLEVTPKGRSAQTFEFTDQVIGDTWDLGEITTRDGVFRVPVFCRADGATIKLINDTHLPGWAIDAAWKGVITVRTGAS